MRLSKANENQRKVTIRPKIFNLRTLSLKAKKSGAILSITLQLGLIHAVDLKGKGPMVMLDEHVPQYTIISHMAKD